MNKKLLWFSRFLFAPAFFVLSYYPLFKHKLPDALFSLDALLAMSED